MIKCLEYIVAFENLYWAICNCSLQFFLEAKENSKCMLYWMYVVPKLTGHV